MSELLEEYGIAPRPPRASAPRWMVTFGDLLTLLLCFFITCITLGPLGRQQRHETTPQNNSNNAAQSSGRDDLHAAGTSIAPITPRLEEHPRAPTLTLYEGDFDEKGEGPWRNAVLLLLGQGVEKARGVDLESCAPEKGTPWSQRLRQSWDLALALRRQVVDSGVPPQTVRVKVSSAGCGSSKDGRRVAARVRLILE
jgi:flagellar motor protein MotB